MRHAPPGEVRLVPRLASPAEAEHFRRAVLPVPGWSLRPDSVDQAAAYEQYLIVRAVPRPAAWRCGPLLARLLARAEKVAGGLCGRPVCVCTALVRRYLPNERRVHPAHYDAHALATVVVSLSRAGQYSGGLYLQPGRRNGRHWVRLRQGDGVCHRYDCRHGVRVWRGARVSLVVWLKDSAVSCREDSTPWYQQAAERSEPVGTYCYALGLAMEGRAEQAIRWYEQAARSGQPEAMLNLGVMLLRGDGCTTLEPSWRESLAMHWWTRAAGAGKPAAQVLVARRLIKEGDRSEEAHKWLLMAAADEDAEALWLLWQDAARQGSREADRQRWLDLAAELGHAQAQARRAWQELEAGRASQALSWGEQSVANGEPEASMVLAAVYMQGAEGLPPDPSRAWGWLCAGAAVGMRQSRLLLDLFYTAGGPDWPLEQPGGRLAMPTGAELETEKRQLWVWGQMCGQICAMATLQMASNGHA